MVINAILNALLMVPYLLSLKQEKWNWTGIQYIYGFMCNFIHDYIDPTDFRTFRRNL